MVVTIYSSGRNDWGVMKRLKNDICITCKEYVVRTKGRYKDGSLIYGKECYRCHWKRYTLRNNKYVQYRKENCEECGFIPLHFCQLDVHHIDDNHLNNEIKNLKTLCANCHRLKHYTKPITTNKET